MNLDDTIVAVATPPGRGGIGVVRLAGPEARAIAAPMLCLHHELAPGRASFGELSAHCMAKTMSSHGWMAVRRDQSCCLTGTFKSICK